MQVISKPRILLLALGEGALLQGCGTGAPEPPKRVDSLSNFEAAVEVMKSVSDAGFMVGSADCGKAPAKG